jgi:hypothetical protein
MKGKQLLVAGVLSICLFATGCGSNTASEEKETEDTVIVQESETVADDTPHIDEAITNDVLTNSTFIYAENTEAVQPYLDAAEVRKQEILSSETTITKSDEYIPGETYTGTAYYFSSINGDDNNDGLSPETPFQSISMYNSIRDSLEYGDAVFFERGSVYRLENIDEWGNSSIILRDGVTYSAYGEGDKPMFTKAIENSAYEDAWELYYEGDSGEKIWKYHLTVQYCAGIVFDDESYATRVMEWPTPDGWLALDEIESDPCHGNVGVWATTNTTLVSTGEYRSVEEALTSDMTYLTRLDLEGCEYPLNFAPGIENLPDNPSKSYSGDLYLRCDEGNPGSLYQDIEIIAAAANNADATFDAWEVNAYVLDNLCIKYTLGPVSGYAGGTDCVIQNCVMGWQGSRLSDVNSEEPTIDYALIGDGIYCVARNAVIQNNYLFQMAEGATFEESMGEFEMGNYTVTGNLMEYCGEGIRIGWNDEFFGDTTEHPFGQIELTDNMILYTGYGFNNNDYEGYFSIELGWDDVQYADSFLVKDNVIIESKFALFMMNENLDATITENVLIQGKNDALLVFGGSDANWIMMSEEE